MICHALSIALHLPHSPTQSASPCVGVSPKAAHHSADPLSPAHGSTQMGLALRVSSCHRL